jgi:hypothetical protein
MGGGPCKSRPPEAYNIILHIIFQDPPKKKNVENPSLSYLNFDLLTIRQS